MELDLAAWSMEDRSTKLRFRSRILYGVLPPWRLANAVLFLLEEQACSTQVNFRFFAVFLVVRERQEVVGKLAYC